MEIDRDLDSRVLESLSSLSDELKSLQTISNHATENLTLVSTCRARSRQIF